MNNKLAIVKYPTYTAVYITRSEHYSAFVREFTRNKLTDYVYDNRFKRYTADKSYFYYDNTEKALIIPAQFTSILISTLKSRGIDLYITKAKINPGAAINLKMNPTWKNRKQQTPAIEFLINYKNSMRGLALQTGKGKSFCAIKTIVKLNKVALILSAGLIEQWRLSVLEQTNLQEEDLYILQGYNSIIDIMESDLRPKIFLASIATIRNFINSPNYKDAPMNYTEFLEHYQIGVKVVDECHENFHAITHIDLRSKVQHNIYLSATYTRSNKSTLAIFNEIFPAKLRYGENNYNKYVNVTFYRYSYKAGNVLGVHGYSHHKYEAFILKDFNMRRTFIDQVLLPCIEAHFINIKSEGQKLLILVSTVALVELLVKELSAHYKAFTINPYTAADSDDNYKEGVDIIVSTTRSAGVGVDIPNLRTVINSVSMQSPGQVKQVLGRLRKLPDDVPEMVDLYNSAITAQVRHFKSREQIYKQLAKKYESYTLY